MADEDIFELLRKQEEAMRKPPVFYVHYDQKTRRIISLRNYLESSDINPYISLTQEDFDFSARDFNISNYVVDPEKKRILHFENTIVQITTIDSYIYEIPKIVSETRLTYKDKKFDLLIEQNNPLKEFRIKLSKPLREKFSLQNMFAQETSVYVTAINDPNILYKTLKFTFSDVIYNEYYTIPFDNFDGNDANIYAIRFFEDYLHVDIR